LTGGCLRRTRYVHTRFTVQRILRQLRHDAELHALVIILLVSQVNIRLTVQLTCRKTPINQSINQPILILRLRIVFGEGMHLILRNSARSIPTFMFAIALEYG